MTNRPPTDSLRPLLTRMAACGDAHFDPDWSLLKLSVYRNIHTEHIPAGTLWHPIRESLHYALILLERDEPGDVERAHAILHKVISLQSISDPSDLRYGLWHYFADEAVEAWPFPDLNWADFNGMTLLMIWHLHGQKLDEATQSLVRGSIRRVAICIRRRNVTMAYTNIAIKGTFVTLAAAELLNDADLMDYAVDRTRRLHAEVFRTACFAEYNSPTYAAVSIAGLTAIANFVQHEPSRKSCREIEDLFWRHVARHFHIPTRELAGPHSRAYAIRLHDAPHMLGTLLMKATEGALDFDFMHDDSGFGGFHDAEFGAFYGYFLKPNLPADARSMLLDATRTETVVEITDPRNTIYAWRCPVPPPDTRDGSIQVAKPLPTQITTYLSPEFTLGSVNLMDGWEQHQNLIGYWKNSRQQVGYLRQRYLHDERACCSGTFASVQREGTVLATSFLVHYCDHHVSVPADEISAEFLGSEIEINNLGEKFALWRDEQPLVANALSDWTSGQHLWLRLPTIWIALKLLAHDAQPAIGIAPQARFDGSRLQIRLPHYQGPRQTFRWSDFERAHTSFALWMQSPQGEWKSWQEQVRRQQPQTIISDSHIAQSTLGKMSLTVPAAVVARENLPGMVSISSDSSGGEL